MALSVLIEAWQRYMYTQVLAKWNAAEKIIAIEKTSLGKYFQLRAERGGTCEKIESYIIKWFIVYTLILVRQLE